MNLNFYVPYAKLKYSFSVDSFFQFKKCLEYLRPLAANLKKTMSQDFYLFFMNKIHIDRSFLCFSIFEYSLEFTEIFVTKVRNSYSALSLKPQSQFLYNFQRHFVIKVKNSKNVEPIVLKIFRGGEVVESNL